MTQTTNIASGEESTKSRIDVYGTKIKGTKMDYKSKTLPKTLPKSTSRRVASLEGRSETRPLIFQSPGTFSISTMPDDDKPIISVRGSRSSEAESVVEDVTFLQDYGEEILRDNCMISKVGSREEEEGKRSCCAADNDHPDELPKPRSPKQAHNMLQNTRFISDSFMEGALTPRSPLSSINHKSTHGEQIKPSAGKTHSIARRAVVPLKEDEQGPAHLKRIFRKRSSAIGMVTSIEVEAKGYDKENAEVYEIEKRSTDVQTAEKASEDKSDPKASRECQNQNYKEEALSPTNGESICHQAVQMSSAHSDGLCTVNDDVSHTDQTRRPEPDVNELLQKKLDELMNENASLKDQLQVMNVKLDVFSKCDLKKRRSVTDEVFAVRNAASSTTTQQPQILADIQVQFAAAQHHPWLYALSIVLGNFMLYSAGLVLFLFVLGFLGNADISDNTAFQGNL